MNTSSRITKPIVLDPRDALVIVDVQRDFCPGGALPVRDCRRMLQVLNDWLAAAAQSGATVVASRDWHPPDHFSFREQGGPWPEHCVRDTPGAEFCAELRLPDDAIVVNKATAPDVEQYSAFEGTDLLARLRQQSVCRLWIGGLVQEVCVRATVIDALADGFEVHVLVDGTAPIEEAAGRIALAEMQTAGATLEQA
jgi:nicotinamidase/pyrazinamidase